MRADKYFSEKFGSRTKSAEAIEKGLVVVNGKTIKPKDEISPEDDILFLQPKEQYVSNGGYKLSRAIHRFQIDCKDKVFVDIGASTGGFTDCLLQNGAKKVYAVDVGESLLDPSIASLANIVKMENTNARYLTRNHFPETINAIVADVSFISLRLIFPPVADILDENGFAVLLIKPQFECDKKSIGKSGILSTDKHVDVVKKVLGYAEENGLYPFGITNAPVKKGKNIEYVLLVKKQKKYSLLFSNVLQEVKDLVKTNAKGLLE